MLTDREQINREIEQKILRVLSSREQTLAAVRTMEEKRRLDRGDAFRLLNHFASAKEEELYWICDAVAGLREKIPDYFTPKERQFYAQSVYHKNEIQKYPAVIRNARQLAPDQWLAAVSVRQLYELYRAQLIFYNTNSQRQLTRRIISGQEQFVITVKRAKVEAIKKELKEGTFIANCITLNVSSDNPENELEYTGNDLILRKGQFDIPDGYHRYLAMMEAAEEDPEFDFMIGLNILSCSEEKANRFIIQEDKQLPMTKWKIAARSAGWQGKLFLAHFSDRETDALYGKIRMYGTQYDSNIIVRTADLVLAGAAERREVILAARRAGDLVNRYADTVRMPDLREVCALIIASAGEECDLERIEKAAGQIPVNRLISRKTVLKVKEEIQSERIQGTVSEPV